MTKEQTFFIAVLSDFLNGRATIPRCDLDWPIITQYAENHQVSGIIFKQCRSFFPAEYGKALDQKYSTELFYYCNRVSLFRKVALALSEANVPFYTVKGLDIAQFYPIPALRTMGDCDIIVHSADKEKAHEVIIELGFETKLKEDMDWMYFKSGMEFEIHDHLLYDEPGNSKTSRVFVDSAREHLRPTNQGTRYELDWSFHLLFLILHLKKHLIHSGVGFRQFMDLDVVIRHCELDWVWIEKTLRELNLWQFSERCFALIKRWFDTPIPFALCELSDEFFEEATEKIFANGVFGFNDESNKSNRELNAITQKSGPRRLVRIQNLIGSAFPAYRYMRYVPHYSFLNGRPWLLPTAWIYRFYRSIRFHMGNNGKRMIENALIQDDRLDEREKELAKWGLS